MESVNISLWWTTAGARSTFNRIPNGWHLHLQHSYIYTYDIAFYFEFNTYVVKYRFQNINISTNLRNLRQSFLYALKFVNEARNKDTYCLKALCSRVSVAKINFCRCNKGQPLTLCTARAIKVLFIATSKFSKLARLNTCNIRASSNVTAAHNLLSLRGNSRKIGNTRRRLFLYELLRAGRSVKCYRFLVRQRITRTLLSFACIFTVFSGVSVLQFALLKVLLKQIETFKNEDAEANLQISLFKREMWFSAITAVS